MKVPIQHSQGANQQMGPPPENTVSLAQKYPWAVFILPFVVYMLLANIEPTRVELDAGPAWKWFGLYWNDLAYPAGYTIRLAVTLLVMLTLYARYRQFPLKFSLLSVVVGIAGVVLWVGLCKLDIEEKLFPKIGLGSFTDLGGRAAYNPLEALGGYPLLLCGFLVVRFIGLALVVPIIEEFILRGFIVRFVLNPEEWLSLPCGVVNRVSLTLPAVYGLLTHPAEALAAVVWFSLVTWLMVRTQNLWDCVMAHAVTNFLLGIYVLTSGDWELW
jgi:CAAX prenyl protease-like protein